MVEFKAMRLDLFDEMFQIEKDYWWYKAKRNYVHRLLRKFNIGGGKTSILDIGCGTGVLLQELKSRGSIFGYDISPEAVAYCKKRGIKNVELGDIDKKVPFKGKKFDLILALDVIEHLEDDYKMSKTISKSLNSGGHFILTTSAYPWLWSYWDEVAGHARRYTKDRLKDVIEKSGLKIKYIRYTNMSIFPPALVFRQIKGKTRETETKDIPSDFVKVSPFVNSLLVAILDLEAFIATHIPLPFGLSFIVVAEKP